MPGESTKPPLVERLKASLDESKQREAASAIERASVDLLGDDHFAYTREAEKLAAMPLDKLEAFIDKVKSIRAELDEAYEDVKKRLGDEQ